MERKPKILLIDDDADFVQVTSKVLKTKPFQIIVAYNGEEGLRKIREEKPDLILLDIMMPVKDGFVVADELKKDPVISKTPVLALTSFSESLGQPFAFEIEEYIKKPIKPNELIATVEKHLKRLGFKV